MYLNVLSGQKEVTGKGWGVPHVGASGKGDREAEGEITILVGIASEAWSHSFLVWVCLASPFVGELVAMFEKS